MKIAALIARLLLGLIFVVFGLNGFLHFIPGPMPSGLAGQFIGALFQSHYVLVVSALQVAGGVLLLVNRYVPLGLEQHDQNQSTTAQFHWQNNCFTGHHLSFHVLSKT